MNKSIYYKENTIHYKNLLTEGHNLDKFIINDKLYGRPDHDFSTLLRLLKPESVVYDIGAYIGTFSIPFALEGMKVHSFEGFPDNCKRLKENCSPYQNIEVYQIAVHNKTETIITKFNDCTTKEAEEREINYVIFDDFIKENNIEHPDLLKIDIEGMETLALFGMTRLLEEIRPIWQVGYHAGLDIKYDGYPGFVKPEDGGFDFNTFTELGYYIYNEHNSRVSQFQNFGEYICVPKEKIK